MLLTAVREHAGITAGEALAQARAEEARCAARNLGIYPSVLPGPEDGSLGQPEVFTLLHHLPDSLPDQLKPHAIITWDPGGYYSHIDHRMVSNVVTELCREERVYPTERLFYFTVPEWDPQALPVLKTSLAKGLLEASLPTQEVITHPSHWL